MISLIKFELEEEYDPKPGEEDKKYPGTVEISDTGICITFKGYGTDAGGPDDSPIFIEIQDGVPVLRVWSNINQEDPTDRISLEDAQESKRQEPWV